MGKDILVVYVPSKIKVEAGKEKEVQTPKNLKGEHCLLGFKIWNLTATGYYAGFKITNRGQILYKESIVERFQKSADTVTHNSYIPFVDQWDVVESRFGMCLSPPAGGIVLKDPEYYISNDDPTNDLEISYEIWYHPLKE